MSHKYFSPEVVSADTEALKFRLKLFIYPTNISWDRSLWKLSSCKHQSFHTCSNLARSMESCWNLLVWTISIFEWQLLMNFRRVSYFLPWVMVFWELASEKEWWTLFLRKLHSDLKETSDREMLPWGLKTLSELVRSFYFILRKSRWVRSECKKPQKRCLKLNGQAVSCQET